MYELGKVIKTNYNGRKVKMFDVWDTVSGARVYFACFVAPVRIANKNLLAYVADRLD